MAEGTLTAHYQFARATPLPLGPPDGAGNARDSIGTAVNNLGGATTSQDGEVTVSVYEKAGDDGIRLYCPIAAYPEYPDTEWFTFTVRHTGEWWLGVVEYEDHN